MLTDIVLSISGVLIGFIISTVLGYSKLNMAQRFLIGSLASLTFIFFLVFGLFDFSLEVGSELNLGLFQLSYGVSESILILLVLILPLVLGLLLVISLRNFNLLKRLVLPIIFLVSIVAINYLQTYREIKQHQWDFETIYLNSLELN